MENINADASSSNRQQQPEYIVRAQWPCPEKQEIPTLDPDSEVRSLSSVKLIADNGLDSGARGG